MPAAFVHHRSSQAGSLLISPTDLESSKLAGKAHTIPTPMQ